MSKRLNIYRLLPFKLCHSLAYIRVAHPVYRRTLPASIRLIMSSATKITQPKWYEPEPVDLPAPLRLYNSLTRSKDVFLPIKGKRVTWYSCGPTTYDASHMGHARNYVTTDINRRILRDYFGYDVFFVQNVTDIDDKIIISARQSYLFDKYKTLNSEAITPEMISTATLSWEKYVSDNLVKLGAPANLAQFSAWVDSADISKLAAENPKFPMHLEAAKSAYTALTSTKSESPETFLQKVRSVLIPMLDAKDGHSVTDPAIFRDLPAYWERKFDDDMKALNVLPTSITTRVSEYVPEIVEFVEKIVSNGAAYRTDDGSVYFDTIAFEKDGKHVYTKLQPWNRGKQELIDEGEGSLSKGSGKRSNNDFALWKASKPGEPAWPSPWGEGRPGWHIECSVMASEVIGQQIDIHSGGIDLAFPHHDNEIAQSEACHDNHQWINYFLHTGHLHIEGQKMSKSLKNFITIREALDKYSSRQLRLAFALQQWNAQFDLKENFADVRAYENTVTRLFSNVKALIRESDAAVAGGIIVSKKISSKEKALLQALDDTKVAVHEAFADNLSVPAALTAISELVSKTNIYLAEVGKDVKTEVLFEVASWITSIFRILGFRVSGDGVGWANEESASASAEEAALPFVQAFSSFRDFVRSKAIEKAPYSDFLTATDKIRNNDLLNLGVSLDDRPNNGPALVKFLDPREQAELIAQRDEKEARAAEKELRRVARLEAEEAKSREEAERAKTRPQDMFKNLPNVAEWDEAGLPVKLIDGTTVPKSQIKKFKKQFDAQTKLYEKHQQQQQQQQQ